MEAACHADGGSIPSTGIEWEGRRRKCGQSGTSRVCFLAGVTLLCLAAEWSVSDPVVTWSVSDPGTGLFVTCLVAFCAYFECICALFLLARKTDLWILCYLQSDLLA